MTVLSHGSAREIIKFFIFDRVVIKPPDGVNYAGILHDLKKHVKPDVLGVKVQGIRETRSEDLRVELKCSKEGRGWWRSDGGPIEEENAEGVTTRVRCGFLHKENAVLLCAKRPLEY